MSLHIPATDFAEVEIGRQFDENGEPLIVVAGMIVGTVDQVKARIDAYARATPLRQEKGIDLYDPRGPFGLADFVALHRQAQQRGLIK